MSTLGLKASGYNNLPRYQDEIRMHLIDQYYRLIDFWQIKYLIRRFVNIILTLFHKLKYVFNSYDLQHTGAKIQYMSIYSI